MQVKVACALCPSWCFLAPGLHLKGPALASHCELLYVDPDAKEEDGPWHDGEVGATKICTISIGVKLYLTGGIGPYFPLWMEYIPQMNQITEETKLALMPR